MVGLMELLRGILEQVSSEVGPMLRASKRFLSEENAENLHGILAVARTTLDDSGPRLSSLLAELNALAGNLDEGMEHLPELTAKLSTLADGLQDALGPDGSRLGQLLDNADTTFAMVGDNRHELEGAVRDLRETAANLKLFSQEIKERPFSLLRIRHEAERSPGEGIGAEP